MDNISDNELYDLCASNNLSFDALQEEINSLGSYVSSQNPLCVHRACKNEKVTLEIVQLLYNTLPGALRLGDFGELPIHRLCCNEDLDETTSIDILHFMLGIGPNLPREMDDNGYLAIHDAVINNSTAFCKELINAYPQSLRIEADGGKLPIHIACEWGKKGDTAYTIQYILERDSELINAESRSGYLPIHYAAMNWRSKSIELLLKYDPAAASKEVNNGTRLLPLHLACNNDANLSSIQVLYDAYPEAILACDNRDEKTPLDLAEGWGNQPAMEFLQTQRVYARQAQDMTTMTTVDDDGWLPLHRALKGNAPLGSIKLLVRGNPAAVQVADQNGVYPVHIACKSSSAKVVKYLVELAGDTLNNVDANKDSSLHYACRRGSLNVLKYLLEANAPSVSERNNDTKLAQMILLLAIIDTIQAHGQGRII